MRQRRKNRKGFTLIELLVVISIVSILASITLVAVNSVRANARDAKRISDLNEIKNALHLYYSDNGHYPIVNDYLWYFGSRQGIFSATAGGNPNLAWRTGVPAGGGSGLGTQLQPYLKEIPIDPINDRDYFSWKEPFATDYLQPSNAAYGYFYMSSITGNEFQLLTWLEKNQALQCGAKQYPLLCPQGVIDSYHGGVSDCRPGSNLCSNGFFPPIPYIPVMYSVGDFKAP